MMKYKALIFSLAAMALFGTIRSAAAHVVVKPNTAGIGAFQTFTMGVPTEKPMATVGLKLVLPEGLNHVSPNVKPGWKVEVKTQATGKKITNEDGTQTDEMKAIEIIWTGGLIPAGQRDEFAFSAQVPATPTTLTWKAYQTYLDGSVVAWDQTPGTDVKNPYSKTSVADDLSNSKQTWWEINGPNITTFLSVIAIFLAGYAVMNKKI